MSFIGLLIGTKFRDLKGLNLIVFMHSVVDTNYVLLYYFIKSLLTIMCFIKYN